MTPLEALEKLKQNSVDNTHLFDYELFEIIGNALIELENRRNTEIVVRTLRESPIITSKKLKALEVIINKKVNVAMLFWYFKYKPRWTEYVKAFQELSHELFEEMLLCDEYELLKEVLL